MALASVTLPSPSKVEGSWSSQLASSHQRWTMLKKDMLIPLGVEMPHISH